MHNLVYCDHCATEISEYQASSNGGYCHHCYLGDSMESDQSISSDIIEVLQEFSENGQKFLLLKKGKDEWEEPIGLWKLVIDLNIGATVFNHPDGRVASYKTVFPKEEFHD